MQYLSEMLPIIIYFLLIVLLVVAIIVGIKLIFTITKVDELIDDVTEKLSSFDRLFNVINFTTDRFGVISETIISFITSKLKKLVKPKRKKTKREDEEYEQKKWTWKIYRRSCYRSRTRTFIRTR